MMRGTRNRVGCVGRQNVISSCANRTDVVSLENSVVMTQVLKQIELFNNHRHVQRVRKSLLTA